MNILTRYVNQLFLLRLVAATAAISLFALMFDMLEVAEDVTGDPSPTWSLIVYGALRMPSLLSEILPIAALLAALFTASELLRSSEIVVMWSNGLSPLRIMLLLVPAGLLVMALKIANDDLLVPGSIESLREWGIGGFRATAFGADTDHLWITRGDDVVRLPLLVKETSDVRGLLILKRDPTGKLTERLVADRAQLEPGNWVLRDVTRQVVGGREIEQIEQLDWPNDIAMSKVAVMARAPRELGLSTLLEIIAADGYGVSPTERHRTWLYYRIAGGFVPMLMGFLGLALAYRFRRGGGIPQLFMRGIAIGFSYLIIAGLCVAFGEAGFLIPVLAALGPTLLLTMAIFSGAMLVSRRAGSGA